MTSRRWYPSLVILLIVATVVVVFDQITKVIAVDRIGPDAGRPIVSVIPDFLEFRYVENTGAAFGILQDSTTYLIFVSVGVVALLAAVFWRLIVYSKLLAFAFGLQFGGAIGNLIDRIRLGYVIDFVDGPLLPVFNVADAGITVGVTLLAIVLLFLPDWSDPEGARQEVERVDDPVAVLSRDGGAQSVGSGARSTQGNQNE